MKKKREVGKKTRKQNLVQSQKPKRTVYTSSKYDKSLEKRIKQIPTLKEEVQYFLHYLKNRKPIPPKYKNHPLKGKLKGIWDSHIRDDMVLTYKYDESSIYLIDIGTHGKLRL